MVTRERWQRPHLRSLQCPQRPNFRPARQSTLVTHKKSGLFYGMTGTRFGLSTVHSRL